MLENVQTENISRKYVPCGPHSVRLKITWTCAEGGRTNIAQLTLQILPEYVETIMSQIFPKYVTIIMGPNVTINVSNMGSNITRICAQL